MSDLDAALPLVEKNQAVEDERGSLPNVPFSAPPASIPSSAPPFLNNTRPNFTSEIVIENKAVSMASNDSSTAISSPAEASPAKSTEKSTSITEETVETSPDTSHIASASDSLTCMTMSIVNMSESVPWSSALPSTTFGNPDIIKDFPAVLTFKGVNVTLENNSVWKQFYSCGTEMILTKQGRRMFPYCRYRLTGLDPDRQYSLVLSITPSGQSRYRWSASRWEVTGPAEHLNQSVIRAFLHHYSPCRGSEWMSTLVSFYKLKLTNNSQDQDGHIILHSLHRYIPRLHVIPIPDGGMPTTSKSLVMGPESMTFTFPQTEFMTVTTYQNFRITQLKINHNPFAKGFREDGNNPRLNRIITQAQTIVKTECQPSVFKPPEPIETQEEAVDLSVNSHSSSASLPNAQETRLVLKPIMSNPANKDEQYVPCIRGKHALGELVLVEPKGDSNLTSVAPEVQQDSNVLILPKSRSVKLASSTSTPGSSPGFRKRRKKINRRWGNSRGRVWKTATASPTVVHSPSLTVAMQPEMDNIEGLLFVSFISKEALDVHVKDKQVSTSSSASPVSLTTPAQSTPTQNQLVVNPETDEEKIARLEAVLLNDLRILKHKQVIHPVLQEVGLKLSSLDLTMSIDLRYLGVFLPLPPPNSPEHSKTTTVSPGDEALPFISRTGKTSDMTKIKGWKNKFIKSKEASLSNCEGLQKDLSPFCSNMLDEYLESEAQQISERAAAFSTNSERSVSYQLPAKSSSYVKTLDSVLKHRNVASKLPTEPSRPCPLSHKPLLYSALTSPAPPLATPAVPRQAGPTSTSQNASSPPDDASCSSYTQNQGVPQRLSTDHPGVSQRPGVSFGQNQGLTSKPTGLTKFQHKLLQMETEALNQGLNRTQLTPERLSAALSVILTKEMQPSQIMKVPTCPENKVVGPECGQEFCRLGCVCSSLQHLNRDPFHCKRPECMFGCACYKSMTNMENAVLPRPGSHANKLWIQNSSDEDPEAVFVPKSAPLCVVPPKVQKRSSVPRLMEPIREEDKDPVYKYLESMMTCARVREFNSKPPPEVTIAPKIFDITEQNTSAKPQKTTDNLSNKYNSTSLTVNKAAESPSPETTANKGGTRKQIQIQSACQWQKDENMILKALCLRMNQNRLSRRFYIGPYFIRPITKTVIEKPNSSIVTYQVQISKPSKASDYDEDECDDSDEEMDASKSFDENSDAEKEDGQIEVPELWFGVTPFLSGVIPAGVLRAERKLAGCQASGLIHVNGKSYNQARLQVGKMGSLHPANRLAAYVTGRLHASVDISHKTFQKPDSTHRTNTNGTVNVKAVKSLVAARKPTVLKASAQSSAQLFQPNCPRIGSITLPHSKKSFIRPVQSLPPEQYSSFSSCQSISSSAPVSLTVSPSLKKPSFLGKSGTYSFRICPPSNQCTEGQKLPGVPLPGGFTLIQLPKPGATGAARPLNATNIASTCYDLSKKDCALNPVKSPPHTKFIEPSSDPELDCGEKMASDESDAAKLAESSQDNASEDVSSHSSDYEGEGEEDDMTVDVETVEELKQELAIAKMKKELLKALLESRDSSDDLGSLMELNTQDGNDESADKKKRKNHTVLERLRRSEHRILFDKLQTVLRSDPRTPRFHLLSLAVQEIQNLQEASRHLEDTKATLMHMQSSYMEKLSLLSGKPVKLIRNKLNEICERQRRKEKAMKWRPFFTQLLQSRAAHLQAAAPQSKPQPSPLLQSDFVPPSHVDLPTTAAQSNLQKVLSLFHPIPQKSPNESSVKAPVLTPTPHPLPQPVFSLSQAGVAAPKSHVEIHAGEHVKQGTSEKQEQVTSSQIPNSETDQQPQVLAVKAVAQASAPLQGPLHASPTPNLTNTTVHFPQHLAIPLIRTRTGRLILPSCLKPIRQSFYTFTVMKDKQKGEEGDVSSATNVQISDVDPPRKLETSVPASDLLLDSEPRHDLENKTMYLDLNPKCSGVSNPLAELAILNKSISVPSMDPKGTKDNQEGVTGAGLNTTLPVACLNFNCVDAKSKPDPSPPVGRRGRGRPRKNPVTTPVNKKKMHTAIEETRKCVSDGEVSMLFEEKESERSTLEETKTKTEDPTGKSSKVADNHVPVKRGRGRPPKNRRFQLIEKAPVKRSASFPLRSNSAPAKHHCSASPNIKPEESSTTATLFGAPKTSRPLTRGSLGKDFPSAKKRSWIDVEKELEPDLDFD